MKKFKNFLYSALSFALMTAMVSCGESIDNPGTEPVDPEVPNTGTSFILECTKGAKAELEFDKTADWQLSNANVWLSVSPLSGVAGKTNVTATALEANEELVEREGTVAVRCNNVNTTYFVIQRPTLGLYLPKARVSAKAQAGQVVIPVEGNVEMEVASSESWLTFDKVNYGEPATLKDGTTKSLYKVSQILMNVESYDGEVSREAIVTLTTEAGEYTVTVRQNPVSGVDYSAEFFRHSIGLRFTATWCGYCPMMGEAFSNAHSNYSDRFIPISLHASSSQGGLAFTGTSTLESYYKVSGYPSGYINDIAEVQNYAVSTTTNIIQGLVDEATEDYPAKTAIAATSTLSGNVLELNVQVAAKEGRSDYKLVALVLEDGIVYPQQSGGSNYVHNYVARQSLTDIKGDVFEVDDESIYETSFEVELSTKIKDINNAYLVLFVKYDGEPTQKGVANAIYGKYGTIIDNAVVLPLDGSVDFKYEE